MKRTQPILYHPGASDPPPQAAVNRSSIKIQTRVMLKWVMIHHYQKTCHFVEITSIIKKNQYCSNSCNRKFDGDMSEVALLVVAAM
jgi:hypothetical protein